MISLASEQTTGSSRVRAMLATLLDSPAGRSSLRRALQIRRVEERLLTLFSAGKLNGTVHTCIGQEWVGVAVAAPLREDDYVFSNHRGHGHFLARTGNVAALIAEVMGKTTGACKGIGGSQHLQATRYFSNGIQGGMVPVAAGAAMDTKLAGRDGISVVFIGDGTLGEGALYEALNIAARWELPLLVVLENNGYAQSTATRTTTAGSIEGRATGLGLAYRRSDTWDPLARSKKRTAWSERSAAAHARCFGKSKRTAFARIRKATTTERRPRSNGLHSVIFSRRFLASAITTWSRSWPKSSERSTRPSWQRRPRRTARIRRNLPCRDPWSGPRPTSPRCAATTPCTRAFDSMLTEDPNSVLIGEDIEGPYGGAFKATKDLSQLFPSRVRNTPISESAITGVATGLALAGRRAVVEIMFGDFLSLTFDQLLQHASKFVEIFGERRQVPGRPDPDGGTARVWSDAQPIHREAFSRNTESNGARPERSCEPFGRVRRHTANAPLPRPSHREQDSLHAPTPGW